MKPSGLKRVLMKARLGTRIERAVKPVAMALRLPCLDRDGQLKPDSPCAKRRDALDGKP